MELERIRNLWFGGKNSEALDAVLNYTGEQQTEVKIVQSLIEFQFGMVNKALETALAVMKNSKKLHNEINHYTSAITYAWLISFQGRFRQALILLLNADNLWTDLSEAHKKQVRQWYGIENIIRGFCVYFTGNKDYGRQSIEIGIKELERINNNWYIAVGYYYKTWIAIFDKRFDVAEKLIAKSISLFTSLDNKTWLAFCTNIQSIIANRKNLMIQAISYSKKSLEMSEDENNFWGCTFATYWIWQHYRKLKEIPKALEYFSSKLQIYAKNKFIPGLSAIYPRIATIYVLQGNIVNAINQYERKIAIDKNHGHELDEIWSHQKIGDIYRDVGNYQAALKEYEVAIKIIEPYERKDLHADILINLGKTHLQFGDLNLARDHLTNGLVLFEEIGDTWKMGETLNLLGEIYLFENQLARAAHSFTQSIQIYENMDTTIFPSNIRNWSSSLILLGRIYQQQEKYNLCIDYFNRGLKYFEEIHDSVTISRVTFYIISVLVKLKQLEPAKLKLTMLEKLAHKVEHPYIQVYIEISKAIILKNSPRMIQKSQSQEIYRQIIDSPVIIYEITVIALLDLSEVLISELATFGEPDVMIELKELFSLLFKLANEKKSTELLIRGIIMQSRLALLELDFENSQKLMQKALNMSADGLYRHLNKEVKVEQKRMIKEMNKWKKFASSNPSFLERMRHFEIEDYLTSISKIIPAIDTDILD